MDIIIRQARLRGREGTWDIIGLELQADCGVPSRLERDVGVESY